MQNRRRLGEFWPRKRPWPARNRPHKEKTPHRPAAMIPSPSRLDVRLWYSAVNKYQDQRVYLFVSETATMGPTLLLALAKEHRLETGEGPVKTPDARELAQLLLPLKTWEASIVQKRQLPGDEISG
jgi:hypothetical protein